MMCPDINVIVGVTQLSRHIDYFRMVAATTWIAQIVDVTFAGAAVRDPTVIMSQTVPEVWQFCVRFAKLETILRHGLTPHDIR